jgi:hypothetical protein
VVERAVKRAVVRAVAIAEAVEKAKERVATITEMMAAAAMAYVGDCVGDGGSGGDCGFKIVAAMAVFRM